MSTTYTTNTSLSKPQTNDTSWGSTLNTTIDAIDALTPVGGLAVTAKEAPSSTLNVKVAAGDYRKSDGTKVSYAGSASQACTLSTTNYVYLTDAGVLTVSTSSFPAATFHVPLATVVTGASTVTTVTDKRLASLSCGANGNTIYLALAGGTMAEAGDVALGTTTGTKIGTSVSQKIGFWNATPVIQQASASQAAVITTAATNTSPYGFATQAQADAIVTLVNRLRLDAVTIGIIKGSA